MKDHAQLQRSHRRKFLQRCDLRFLYGKLQIFTGGFDAHSYRVMGAVTTTTVIAITVTMMWMAAHGYAITGVWLTITPTGAYQREHDDDMALL